MTRAVGRAGVADMVGFDGKRSSWGSRLCSEMRYGHSHRNLHERVSYTDTELEC